MTSVTEPVDEGGFGLGQSRWGMLREALRNPTAVIMLASIAATAYLMYFVTTQVVRAEEMLTSQMTAHERTTYELTNEMRQIVEELRKNLTLQQKICQAVSKGDARDRCLENGR